MIEFLSIVILFLIILKLWEKVFGSKNGCLYTLGCGFFTITLILILLFTLTFHLFFL